VAALLVAASLASCGGDNSTVSSTSNFTIQRTGDGRPTSTDRQPGSNQGGAQSGGTGAPTTSTGTTSTQTSTGSSGGTPPPSGGGSSGGSSGGTSPGDQARQFCNTHPGACD
jgi:hypothetical protein